MLDSLSSPAIIKVGGGLVAIVSGNRASSEFVRKCSVSFTFCHVGLRHWFGCCTVLLAGTEGCRNIRSGQRRSYHASQRFTERLKIPHASLVAQANGQLPCQAVAHRPEAVEIVRPSLLPIKGLAIMTNRSKSRVFAHSCG